MNTTKKGTEFEELCCTLITEKIENFELGLLPAACRVVPKGRYFSKDRNDYIEFDISIELWLDGAPNYSMLILIECKDYSKKIPVDDIEEFYQKVQQVTGANVKGVFISRTELMTGAFSFARSKGIMLMQVNDNITLNIILHKARMQTREDIGSNIQIELQLYEHDIVVRNQVLQNWESKIENVILSAFLANIQTQNSNNERRISVYSAEDIAEIVECLLQEFDSRISQYGRAINYEAFIKFLEDVYELKVIHKSSLGTDSKGRKLISSCNLLQKEISIDTAFIGTPRYSFLLCHELGHFFLHDKIAISQSSYELFEDTTEQIGHSLTNERNWIEWQANIFAMNLVMPKISFVYQFILAQKEIGLRDGMQALFVDDQPCNQQDYHKITGALSNYFSTTKVSVTYRLESLKLIKYGYNAKRIKDIIGSISDWL
jgi:Zn-dependent peptidase ImmA (M78 family)